MGVAVHNGGSTRWRSWLPGGEAAFPASCRQSPAPPTRRHRWCNANPLGILKGWLPPRDG